ncbi:MAG: hypothetical protein QXJ17_08065 [Nitrososphaeria archaeon]
MEKKIKHVTVTLIILILTFSLNLGFFPVQASSLTTLTPGIPATIEQDLQINVVFVGFDPSWIDESVFLSWQLPDYSTIIRSRSWYGVTEPLGLVFNFDYNLVFAPTSFAENLFEYIPTVSIEGPLYSRQIWYNGLSTEERAGFTIEGSNYYVDAPSVELWLEENADSLGIDAVNQYTIFFINGLDNYFPHSYWFVDEPDPDTGVVFGAYGSRQMTGWGGQFGRTWFLDLSAGPDRFLFETSTKTYESGVRPIWEFDVYGGYRTDLTERLAKIARFVGVDMLFTPSPLYPTYLQPPLLPQHIQFDVNMFENSSMYIGSDWFNPSIVEESYEDFEPYLDFSVSFQDRQLMKYPVLNKAFANFASGNPYSIFGRKSPYWWAASYGIDFHLYYKDQLFKFLTTVEGSQADYSVPIFAYAVDDEQMGVQFGLGGFADDNWLDGTQEYVQVFNTPYWANVGYGYTLTTIHETGHHLGMSHPHDGYDPVYGEAESALGQAAWVGDHSYTVMNYHDITYHFGVFNKDSMYRYMTITYLNYANKILAMISKNPNSGKVASMIQWADDKATSALEDYQDMNYYGSVTKMKLVYDKIVDAALKLHIPLESSNWQSSYKGPTITLFDPLLSS